MTEEEARRRDEEEARLYEHADKAVWPSQVRAAQLALEKAREERDES